jgi:hypothetical protein
MFRSAPGPLRRGACLLAALALGAPATAGASSIGGFWEEAARLAGLPSSVLYGIALQEAGARWGDGTFRPWPWTLNTPRGPVRYASREEAVAGLRNFVRDGVRNIDVGLMQVNLRWHGARVRRPEDLLDPRTNIAVAAQILREEKHIGHYHSKRPERARAYAARVARFASVLEK